MNWSMSAMGPGFNFPVALEGALKLKEISYIHAEGYPAAEMKHGPIALIDQFMPVVVIAPCNDPNAEKLQSNIEEVLARGGTVIALQLMSYYIADMRQCNVDQPRNLAKSVTVEYYKQSTIVPVLEVWTNDQDLMKKHLEKAMSI